LGQADQQRAVDLRGGFQAIKLEVHAVQQSVEVSGATQPLRTTNIEISTNGYAAAGLRVCQ
jgi:hypothetical protein